VAAQLRQASTAARDALAEARLTLLGLASSPLNGQTLDAALRSEAAWAQSMGGLEVRYVSAGTPPAMEERLSREVLGVAREALTNIVRHAQASSVRLGLMYEQAAVTLLVQDDGQGFDPKAEWQGDRFGLRAISERARVLGATVDVDSLAGWGTRIRARFPYRWHDEQAGPRLRVLVAAWSARSRRRNRRWKPAGTWGVPADRVVVVEDSRNGLLAATGAGLTCMITVNDFTAAEDFSEAALVVSSLGDPGGEPTTVLANRSRATPGAWITLADLTSLGAPMPAADLGDVEAVVRTIATVAVDNEKYFGDLDAVVGDGDFGYSMARGFELVLQGWDDFDRTDIGTFLKKIAVVITSRIGGTSGPIWGTAFLRAGTTAGPADGLEPAQVIAMLRASIEGIKARGKSDVGDKTLLDALVPAVDTIEEQVSVGHDAAATLRAAAATAREHAEATRSMQAKRGRRVPGRRVRGTTDGLRARDEQAAQLA